MLSASNEGESVVDDHGVQRFERIVIEPAQVPVDGVDARDDPARETHEGTSLAAAKHNRRCGGLSMRRPRSGRCARPGERATWRRAGGARARDTPISAPAKSSTATACLRATAMARGPAHSAIFFSASFQRSHI